MADTDYALLAEFKARVNVDAADTSADGMLQQMLNAAAYVLDFNTRRPPRGCIAFSATSGTRYFDDDGTGYVAIDDLLLSSAVTVKRGGVTVDSTSYKLAPYNEVPKTEIIFNYTTASAASGSWYGYPFSSTGAGQIEVTGDWGFCAAASRPAVVKEATLRQAEIWYEERGLSLDALAAAMRDPRRACDARVMALLDAADLVKERSVPFA